MSSPSPDPVSLRRSGRSSLGNRLAQAIAEELVVPWPDATASDEEYVLRDEEDALDADFESTDEEAEEESADSASDTNVRQESRSKSKKARPTHAERTLAIANVQQKHTFLPHTIPTNTAPSALTAQQEESSTEHLTLTQPLIAPSLRQSQRTHTVLSTIATVDRARTAQTKRSRRTRAQGHDYTQSELIQRALDSEAGNTMQHKNYLKSEAQKRKRIRPVSNTVQGPYIRWVSVTAPTQTVSQDPSGPDERSRPIRDDSSNPPPTPLSPARSSTLKTLNFLVHRPGPTSKSIPTWETSMTDILGDHVDWNSVKVLSDSAKVSGRRNRTCPITGKIARYIDPHTSIPYADVRAYATIREVLSHEYLWSDERKRYVKKVSQEPPVQPEA